MALALIFSCTENNQERKTEQKHEKRIFNSLVDSIDNNDTLFIRLQSEGCFHFYKEEFKMFKRSDSLFAHFLIYDPLKKRQINSSIQPLSDLELRMYSKFEKNGKALKTINSCTSTDSYTINFKTQNINFVDSSCQFEDYHAFKRSVFSEVELVETFKEIFR